MFENMMNGFSGSKLMERMFRKADGVVWDLMTGKIGIKVEDGIATCVGEGEDATVSINMIEQFGMALPAFAQSTPPDAVAAGDIIYFGAKDRPGFVIDKKQTQAGNTSFILLKTDGQRTQWSPPKVSLLGFDAGVMVLRPLINMLPGGQGGMQGLQNSLMPLMLMGDGENDIESVLPLMLMGQMQAPVVQDANGNQVAAPNPMAQMLPTMLMMKMLKESKGSFKGR